MKHILVIILTFLSLSTFAQINSVKPGSTEFRFPNSGNAIDTFATKADIRAGGATLYSGTGSNTNGAMTQNATTVALAGKVNISSTIHTYYVSSSSGNDTYTASQAKNPNTPWASLSKVNASMGTFASGDSIVFKNGDTFNGSLNVTTANLYFGAYGNGAQPIISGFTSLSSWTTVSGNVKQSSCATCSANLRMVVINGKNRSIGRYPNSHYLYYQSFSGNTSITSDSLTGTPNWTGADLIVRKERYMIEKHPITSQSSGTLTYSGGEYNGNNGYGFIIANDARTLDTAYEWYLSGNNLQVYWPSTTSTVLAATSDTLIYINHVSNVTFDNIAFQGSNIATFQITNASNAVIKNCNLNYSGTGAIEGINSSYAIIDNNIINNSQGNGIELDQTCQNQTITNNSVNNTYTILANNPGGTGTGNAIQSLGNNGIVYNNKVINSGGGGISFTGIATTVSKNTVDTFAYLKDDGGGIYCGVVTTGTRYIDGNTVSNGLGAGDGTPYPDQLFAEGIYTDDNIDSIYITNNSSSNNSDAGLKIHNSQYIFAHNNNFYNNANQFLVQCDVTADSIKGLNITNNLFANQKPGQYVINYSTFNNDINLSGIIDSNYYIYKSDTLVFLTHDPTSNPTHWYDFTARSFSGWKTLVSKDANTALFSAALMNAPIFANSLLLPVNAVSSASGTIDASPASGSSNAVSSGGVYIALAGKASTSGPTISNATLTGYPNLSLLKISRFTRADVNYTMTGSEYLIAYTSLTATRTITLPSASSCPNTHFIIKDESGNASPSKKLTLSGTVDGITNPDAVTTAYGSYFFYSNGTSFFSENASSNATSATYTPTFTLTTNLTGNTFHRASYMQIGNIVYVTIYTSFAPSANGNTILTFTLPVTTTNTTQNVVGSGTSIASALTYNGLVAVQTGTTASYTFNTTGTTQAMDAAITFQYSIN